MKEFMGISIKLTKFFVLLGNIDKQCGAVHNITPSQVKILSFIGQRLSEGKRVFQKDIEKEFGLKGSSVSSILNNLEKNDWIKRKSVEYDARLKSIVFSDKSEIIVKYLQALHDILDDHIKDSLSDAELIVFNQCIDKITNSLISRRELLGKEFDKLEEGMRREIENNGFSYN